MAPGLEDKIAGSGEMPIVSVPTDQLTLTAVGAMEKNSDFVDCAGIPFCRCP
jgi:hypothetical protein